MGDKLFEIPHRRYNPLTDSWVLVSPHRSNRPWQGQVEKTNADTRPSHDPTCYLCARNTRANGEKNPDYKNVYVFDNDFAAIYSYQLSAVSSQQTEEKKDLLRTDSLKLIADSSKLIADSLFISQAESGICRVICFSPQHNLTIPEMPVADIRKVVDAWVAEYAALSKIKFIEHVQIFENKGAVMGCSNPHPHGQIWAQSSIPDEPLKKQKAQLKYFSKNKKTLLSDYLEQELEKKERILFQNAHFVGLVPFWAVWPFEAMLIPKRPMARITDMNESEKTGFADAYKQLTMMYDRLFQTSFPYSAGIHQAPTDGKAHPEWHFHKVFYPPLLRSATVKKFMVGYEMLANAQRDITPEKAALLLMDNGFN